MHPLATWTLALGLVLASTTALADSLRPAPAGYLSVARGLCRFEVPTDNAGVIAALEDVCGEPLETIADQLGLLGSKDLERITVRVVKEMDEIRAHAPLGRTPARWSQAVAFPDVDAVILALRNQQGGPVEDLEIVLRHELAHLAAHKALKGRDVPRWLSEGLAIQQSELSSFQRYLVLFEAGRGGTLRPLAELGRYPEQTGAVSLAYAEAADFVGFLLRKEGWFGMRVLLRKLAAGQPLEDAFDVAFNSRPHALEQEWLKGLQHDGKWLPMLTGSGLLWGMIVALFFAAVLAAKRRKRQRFAAMDDEERVFEHMQRGRPPSHHLPLAQRLPPRDPTAGSTPPGSVPSKIRIDDDIHTLH